MQIQLIITIMLMFFLLGVAFYCVNTVSEDPAK